MYFKPIKFVLSVCSYFAGSEVAALAICGLSCVLPAFIRCILFAHCINRANPVCTFPDTSSIHLNAAVHPAVSLCFIARPLRKQNPKFLDIEFGGKSKNRLALAWWEPCSALGLAKERGVQGPVCTGTQDPAVVLCVPETVCDVLTN
jgi:hypothetical protein